MESEQDKKRAKKGEEERTSEKKERKGKEIGKQKNCVGFRVRIWAQLKFYYIQAGSLVIYINEFPFATTSLPSTSLRTRPKKRRSTIQTEFRHSLHAKMRSATYIANSLKFD